MAAPKVDKTKAAEKAKEKAKEKATAKDIADATFDKAKAAGVVLEPGQVKGLLVRVGKALADGKLKDGKYKHTSGEILAAKATNGMIGLVHKDKSNVTTCVKMNLISLKNTVLEAYSHFTPDEQIALKEVKTMAAEPLPEDIKPGKAPAAPRAKKAKEIVLRHPNQTLVPMAEAVAAGFKPTHMTAQAVKVQCACGNVRYCATQDAFQVTRCLDCKKASKKKAKDEAPVPPAKEKKAKKTAAA